MSFARPQNPQLAPPLRSVCGTLAYTAPEVFPGRSSGDGPLVDIFSLGVMVYGWLYDPPNPPKAPRGENEELAWHDKWVELLLGKLHDEKGDRAIQILLRMIETKVTSRWSAAECLAQGFRSHLFKRRLADGLIGCASDLDAPIEVRENLGTKPRLRRHRQAPSWMSATAMR